MTIADLMSRADTLKVERVAGCGVKVRAVVENGSTPLLVEYDRVDSGNTRLKMTALPDEGLSQGVEGRVVDVCLFSDECIAEFFTLIRDVQELGEQHELTRRPAAPAMPF